MKCFYLCVFIAFSSTLYSQTTKIPERKTQKSFGKIDFLSVDMPLDRLMSNTPNMGLTGIHYNLFLNNWSYAGIGIYGAVTGDKGGFFTLGINAGIRTYINHRFFVDGGLHFGGGGGGGAPDGGGAFILPQINLGYQFNNFSISSGWSYINFFDKGNIKSNQLNVAITIPISHRHASYSSIEKGYKTSSLKKSDWNRQASKTSLMFHLK